MRCLIAGFKRCLCIPICFCCNILIKWIVNLYYNKMTLRRLFLLLFIVLSSAHRNERLDKGIYIHLRWRVKGTPQHNFEKKNGTNSSFQISTFGKKLFMFFHTICLCYSTVPTFLAILEQKKEQHV